MLEALAVRCPISKQSMYKANYSFGILLVMIVVINITACMWLALGEALPMSWINNPVYGLFAQSFNTDRATKYITSIYWVVTTLATVGYGDVKGFTYQEYLYTMFMEFVGIAIFSIIMGSINNIFLFDSGTTDSSV